MKTLIYNSVYRTIRSYSCLLILGSILFTGCSDIEVEPPGNQLSSDIIFEDATTTEAALLGIYISMMQQGGFASGGQQSITSLAALSADEFINHSTFPEQGQFYSNALLPNNSWLEIYLWNEGYKYIYQANAIIEGLQQADGIDEEVKKRLISEAYFIRGFSYFNLINLFGPVPLVTSIDYQVNRLIPRAETSLLQDQIEEDFLKATEGLPEDYSFAAGERVRPNKWAAHAMLARYYLYNEVWDKAELHAELVIQQNGLYELLTDPNEVFLANSRESIWQLQPVIPNQNTMEGLNYLLLFTPFNVSLSPELVAEFSNEGVRKDAWLDSLSTGTQVYYYPTKYKVKFGSPVTEYSSVIRLAELYFIGAEAKIELGDLAGGRDDLNAIRSRAGLSPVELSTAEDLLEAVYHERRLELFTESGHRWFDLKRTGRATEVLETKKPEWKSTDVLYPIPQTELNRNPNLEQNPGY